MLVIQRLIGQEIQIGDNITIQIVAINGNKVRLGFKIPRDIQITRSELLRKVNSGEDQEQG